MDEHPPVDASLLQEEVRIAMALNGGVSLAVWMGGCAVELDCARRAHLGAEPIPPAPTDTVPRARALALRFFTGARPPAAVAVQAPERTIYSALCGAFHRRLVLDIFAGASAGGINGAMLAGVIAKDRRLHPDFVRDCWLTLGDMRRILQQTSVALPPSLMQGTLFGTDLESTFGRLLAASPEDWLRPPAGQRGGLDGGSVPLKLRVTTTSALGSVRSVGDAWGRKLEARDYRALFAFDADFQPKLLAQAARSSASFPVAFAPWDVSDAARKHSNLGAERWVIDGGLLDNAPIRVALGLIPAQPASHQVQRYACYVNPHPGVSDPEEIGNAGPGLLSVFGWVVNLPRLEPLVDELDAVRAAERRAALVNDGERRLLALDDTELQATAEALLPEYRRRRRLDSLIELIGEDRAVRVNARFAGSSELPWIPAALSPAPGEWRWGVRPAERILHLQLDLLRSAVYRLPIGELRGPLYDARKVIDKSLKAVACAAPDRDAIVSALAGLDDGARLDEVLPELDTVAGPSAPKIRAALRVAANAMAAVRTQLVAELGEEPIARLLPGSGNTLDDAGFEAFLARVLAVEVIRRAFSDEHEIVSGQQVLFCQLTPEAPGLLFTATPRLTGPQDREYLGWCSAAAKLTGLRLLNFSGFYRRSWRANDFMWGRLDAAARIVELLLDRTRALELIAGDTGAAPWKAIADVVLPGDDDNALADERWLVAEALHLPVDPPGPAAELRQTLEQRLHEQLRLGDDELARIVCIRAAQLEILRHELPVVVAESQADARLGAGAPALKLPPGPHLRDAIADLRPAHEPLPKRLGASSPSELSSALGLRTVAQAALVTLAMARTVNRRLGALVAPLRAVVLPIAGLVSAIPAYRAATVLGFWAAALYITARMLTLDPGAPATLDLLPHPDVLVTYVAALLALGVVLVPVARVVLPATGAARIAQGAWTLVFAAAAGTLAVAAALQGLGDVAHVLVAPGAEKPVWWLTAGALLLLAGHAVGQLGGFGLPLSKLAAAPWLGYPALAVSAVLAVGFVLSSWGDVWAQRGTSTLAGWAAWLALAGPPLAAGSYAFLAASVRSRLRR